MELNLYTIPVNTDKELWIVHFYVDKLRILDVLTYATNWELPVHLVLHIHVDKRQILDVLAIKMAMLI